MQKSGLVGSRLYTNVMLTVIGVLLAWSTLTRIPVAHAQGATWQHTVATLKSPYYIERNRSGFEKALNEAAKGGELVALVPTIQQSNGQFVEYMAVFRKQ